MICPPVVPGLIIEVCVPILLTGSYTKVPEETKNAPVVFWGPTGKE